MRARFMAGTIVVIGFLVAAPRSARGDNPELSQDARPWACTSASLMGQATCTVDGRSASASPSKDRSRKARQDALVIGNHACDALALGERIEPNATILAGCRARIQTATKRCGGDGTRPLLDDDGRFNPGHARCYGALANVLREMSEAIDAFAPCCECAADRCGVNEEQCIDSASSAMALSVPPVCVAHTCATSCAQVVLAGRASSAGASGARTTIGSKP